MPNSKFEGIASHKVITFAFLFSSPMTLIKSISGIRGTIGGLSGDNLTPLDILRFTSAFSQRMRKRLPTSRLKVVVGRDARVSGEMVSGIVTSTLSAMGVDVIDLGLSTTPTVEMAVVGFEAQGGIIITASHNPAEWNALKLLDENGEFLSAAAGAEILELAESNVTKFSSWDELGKVQKVDGYFKQHINSIKAHPLVDLKAIQERGFKIVVDAVNSTGGLAVPKLLEAFGVAHITCINCEPTGVFAHNPEPLPEHLRQISEVVRQTGADLGIVVDPDVDRLALISEDGTPFGEEYTLVAVADYFLRHRHGPVVSNLSSSRALKDVAARYGQEHHGSAVGEVNVVAMMKEVNAVVGGEGNGGIIIPDLHYGRDALAGIAFILTHLAQQKCSLSALRSTYPEYHMVKEKVQLDPSTDIDKLLRTLAYENRDSFPSTVDGLKIDERDYWIHIRKSNTEPILRLYVEAESLQKAKQYAQDWRKILMEKNNA